MERDREDAALGALELAGICRETVRVIRSSRSGFSFMVSMVITLSTSLLAHVPIARALFGLFSDVVASSDAGAGLVRLATNWEFFFLEEAACLLVILVQSLGSAAFLRLLRRPALWRHRRSRRPLNRARPPRRPRVPRQVRRVRLPRRLSLHRGPDLDRPQGRLAPRGHLPPRLLPPRRLHRPLRRRRLDRAPLPPPLCSG
ncbi:hypothetical protein ACQJBY_029292 [Aegilops geniculata]